MSMEKFIKLYIRWITHKHPHIHLQRGKNIIIMISKTHTHTDNSIRKTNRAKERKIRKIFKKNSRNK